MHWHFIQCVFLFYCLWFRTSCCVTDAHLSCQFVIFYQLSCNLVFLILWVHLILITVEVSKNIIQVQLVLYWKRRRKKFDTGRWLTFSSCFTFVVKKSNYQLSQFKLKVSVVSYSRERQSIHQLKTFDQTSDLKKHKHLKSRLICAWLCV